MSGRLFLIDGHALIFKMYYAFLQRPMINSKGADMSILYGVTKYILEMIEREKPTHLAVSFDPPGGTFRNELYPEYKGTRPPTPQLIIDSLEPMTEIIKAMNISVVMVPGFEADDVIGSMSKRFEREGFDVYMVTPDKDYGQLISDHVFQYKPGKGGGESEIIDAAAICSKYNILDPIQVIDMLAICGDTADNVPGVKGVGEVGAGKLISKYGSIENIYAHLDELPPRQKAMFEEARDHIELSKELVTIKTDMDLDVSAEDLEINMDFSPSLADLFEKYEFNSLLRFLPRVKREAVKDEREEVVVKEVLPKDFNPSSKVALIIDPDGPGIFSGISSVTLAADGNVASCGSPQDFKAILEDPSIIKYGYDLKLQSNLLAAAGITLGGRRMDIELMHYLINPEKSHKVEILAKSYLGMDIEEPSEAVSTLSLFDEADSAPKRSRAKEAVAILLLGQKISEEAGPLMDLYEKMEEPLSKILSKMERDGVKVDMGQIASFAEGLRAEMVEREKRIRQMTGEPTLNVSSPKQVGDVLFDKMKLDPKAKKSARGQYSTDETTLLEIADRHPVVDEILEFRAVKKLLSTYIEPFPTFVSPVDGRVHTTFNQALTATGRLSSSNPNLQNIPIRTERGKEIRKAFVPGTPDGLVMSADYSQIELRIMAHLSCDEHLIKAFRDGVDVHQATAAKIFGKDHSEVTSDERRIAKTANFGIMYGISSFGLAQRLRIGRKEAKKLIDDYFESFPAINSFIKDTIESAKENGYVETIFGRRRYLPDINSHNATVRALSERNAVNAPIQGTAADVIKLAMINVDRAMKEAGVKSRMVLQIHDELLFDVVKGEEDIMKEIVVREMESVVKLSVPLTVECNIGKNWLEAH